jgi:RimJ/RimL family protein N-acetyltransferase
VDVQQAGAVRAMAHIFPQDAHPFPRARVLARWASEVASPDVDVLVVERDPGRIVGFAAIRANQLLHFGTAVETWGTGLATAAHAELLEHLKAGGTTTAWLKVFEDNHRARRFYEREGWRPTDELSRSSFPPYPTLVHYVTDL